MFPDSSIASNFNCGRTKTTYLINEGISIANIEKLKEKLNERVFSLAIDESNKKYAKKYLCLMVKYFDKELNSIQINFLGLKKISISDGNSVRRLVVESFEENELSFDNCIQIMSDNASVNRGCHNGAITQIKNTYAKHLVDIGGCSLHHISNACEHGLKKLYRFHEIEEFVQDVSSFFILNLLTNLKICKKF